MRVRAKQQGGDDTSRRGGLRTGKFFLINLVSGSQVTMEIGFPVEHLPTNRALKGFFLCFGVNRAKVSGGATKMGEPLPTEHAYTPIPITKPPDILWNTEQQEQESNPGKSN
eukprot:TRINITY_DN147_c0_g1_i11.p1 TRINITY_DN147_c0_g1~~TRINITY_DN147_c0_g1_i11.p1  ORF type:complete len:112 (-),score=7.20 TRINITY_DN147_c0_g1_i11:235-570(-)